MFIRFQLFVANLLFGTKFQNSRKGYQLWNIINNRSKNCDFKMCYSTKGSLERETTTRGPSSLMPLRGLSSHPVSGEARHLPRASAVSEKQKPENLEQCLCFSTAVSTVLCTLGACSTLWSVVITLQQWWTPRGDHRGPSTPGSTWEGTSTINRNYSLQEKEQKDSLCFWMK